MTFMSLRHSGVMICIRLCLIHVFRRSLSFHQFLFFFTFTAVTGFLYVGGGCQPSDSSSLCFCVFLNLFRLPSHSWFKCFFFFFLWCLDGTQFGLPRYHLTIVSPSTVSRSLFNLCLYLSVPSTSLEAYSALINLATPSHTLEKRTVS